MMRTIPRWARVRAPISVAIAGALLTVFGQATTAQQPANAASQDSTPLTLLFIVFPDTASAQSAAASLSSDMSPAQGYAEPQADSAQPSDSAQGSATAMQNVEWIEPYYAIASMDKKGKVTVQDHGQKGKSTRDSRAENSIEGVSALLGEKPSSGGGQAAGAGASQSGISSSSLRDMQGALDPGEAALIIVVAEPMADDVTSQMKQAHASDVVAAPLVVVTE
jgi:hypothetical protein